MKEEPRRRMLAALNRLCKWRSVFAGWQLGTRSNEDPECQAVRDHREATLIQRAELTALIRLLDETGVLKRHRLEEVIAEEADHLSEALSRQFPGFRATDDGMEMDVQQTAQTTQGWKP